MKLYKNKAGHLVTLTRKTATNKGGDKLLWVRCENGTVCSIWEKEFAAQFKAA